MYMFLHVTLCVSVCAVHFLSENDTDLMLEEQDLEADLVTW